MKIEIFESELIQRKGFNGFYGFFLSALTRYKGAKPTHEPRPLPCLLQPREHESAWIRVNGHLVFFDMSDHIFFYDIEALKLCEVYFKANLNWPVTDRVLAKDEVTAHRGKIVPFMFFADQLDHYPRHRAWNAFWHGKRRAYDVCHVTGVYMNPVRENAPSVFSDPTEPITPANYHFWIRYETQQAMKQAGISGYFRLTSRANKQIEDQSAVYSNISQRAFARHIFDARMTVINTLPHAVLPWKATESLAMGRPLILDIAPLIEVPEPFTLKPNIHFLELFPVVGGFDLNANLDDPASYRVLTRLSPSVLIERCAWLQSILADNDRIDAMTEQANYYARTILTKPVVADYICDQINAHIH
ncbi:MAG: hypothetical protein WCI95_04600 [bacterium]